MAHPVDVSALRARFDATRTQTHLLCADIPVDALIYFDSGWRFNEVLVAVGRQEPEVEQIA